MRWASVLPTVHLRIGNGDKCDEGGECDEYTEHGRSNVGEERDFAGGGKYKLGLQSLSFFPNINEATKPSAFFIETKRRTQEKPKGFELLCWRTWWGA